MLKKFNTLALFVLLLLSGCELTDDNSVDIPTNDPTLPATTMDVYDPDLVSSLNEASAQPVTIIAVEDVVSVLASARDDDGGIKAVRMWASFTYYRPGQTVGPILPGAPVTENVSTASVGQRDFKSRLVAYNFDLKTELVGWSRIKVDVWIEGENFHGGKVQTPVVSLTYPTRQDGDTDYMAFCRKRRVPIPPDWAESGTAWILQGNLRTGSNLLQPGKDAYVWTYQDPVRRGACIALPRGSGAAGSLGGFICQSAATGNACFWDNRIRDNNDPLRQVPAVGWSGQLLRISELKDASNLTEPQSGICTDCHRGDNVFLISPDDPTWANVLRSPLVTSPGSTFTTRVEGSSETIDGHFRYLPVTFPASRPNWVNTYKPGGCAGACHENPDLGFATFPPMPPSCALNGDVENCYR